MRTSGDFGILLGIDFGGTKIAIAAANPQGAILKHRVISTKAELGAGQALKRTLDVAAELIKPADQLLAAGVATPGAIHDDAIQLAPNVPGWDELHLASAVRERFEVARVEVVNDLDAAALAELKLGSLRVADPGLVVGLGTGIAVALTVGGVVVKGSHSAAGEIGYAPVGAGELVGDEETLEEVFSGAALDSRGREFGVDDAAGMLNSLERSLRLETAARFGALARQLVSACLLLDPERVVLVGGMTQNESLCALIRQVLQQYVPMPPEVVVSSFPQDTALHGVVALAVDLTARVRSDEHGGPTAFGADDHEGDGSARLRIQ